MTWRVSADTRRPSYRVSAAIPRAPGSGGGDPTDPTPGTGEPTTPPGGTVDPAIPNIRWRRRSVFANENAGTVNLELELTHSYHRTVVVDIQHVIATATAIRGTDWNWNGNPSAPNLQSVYFAPGQTTLDVPCTIVDDASVEAAEVAAFYVQGAITTKNDGTTIPVTVIDENAFGFVINANDTPAVPDVNWSTQTLEVAEGATSTVLRVTLSETTTVPVSGSITITPGPGVTSGDYTIPTTYLVPAGQQSVVIPITAATDTSLEGSESLVLTLGAPTNGVLGLLDDCTVTITDATVTPVVEWTQSSFSIVEGSSGLSSVDVTLNCSNWAQVQKHEGFTVQVQLTGTATPGVDYTLAAPALVGFAPGEQSRIVRFQVQGDADIEPDETIIATLTQPNGCALGGAFVLTGTIINDDQATGGEQLRPSLYYPSEVFHVGGETLQMVVELNETFGSAVNITYRTWEGPNTVSGDHGLAATGNFDIDAGSRYGFLSITVPGASTTGSQKRFYVELTGTSHGQLGLNTRFVGIILGDTDVKDVIPPRPTVPGTDDIRVWSNRFRISPFAVDVSIPEGEEQIGYALRHTSNQYQAMWAAKNPTYPEWGQQGTPVVVRVMEDLAISTMTKKVEFGVTQSVFSPSWIGLGNPGGSSATQKGARDLIIIGDGGTPRAIRGVTFSTSYGWATSGLTNDPEWPTMAVDNIQLRNLKLKPPPGVYGVIESNGNNNPQADHHGVIHLYDCIWDETDALTGGLLGDGNMRMGARINNRSSWRVEGCTFKAHEHCFYADRMSGLCLFYNNNNPGQGTRGVGRSLIQVVARPGEGGGSGGHGLLAIINNTTTDNGWKAMDGAKDITVVGFCGEVIVDGNTHDGHIQEPGQNTNNRGFVGVLMSGNQNGLYTFLYPLLSGFWAGYKRVRCQNEVINCVNTDQWNGNPFFYNGAAFLELGPWTVTSAPPLGSGRAVIEFNGAATASNVNLLWDMQGRLVDPTRWTTPSGFSYAHNKFPNRPGSVSYLGAVASAGFGAYLFNTANNMVSGQKATHRLIANSLVSAQVFGTLPSTTVDGYNGNDL